MSARNFWMMSAALTLAVGCTNATSSDTETDSTEKVEQPLGESSRAYWFAGNGADVMPDYDERVVWHLINQVRMNTDVFEVRDMDGNLIPPAPPMIQQVGMTEAGRWHGAHALEYSCTCFLDQMSMTFVSDGAGNNPYTCCTAGLDDGSIECTGPVVGCGDDGMMEPADRWGLLNKGPGEVRSEIFYTSQAEEGGVGAAVANWFLSNALGAALGERTNTGAAARTSIPILPDECQPPEDTCEGGDCVGPNGETDCDPNDPDAPNECIGTCQGGSSASEFCTLPEPVDPARCDPEALPRSWHWSFLFGQTSEPTPFLNDVIHIELEEGTFSFLANYFDPVGTPESLQIVTDSSCNDMSRSFERPNEGMGGADMGMGDDMGTGTGLPYAGNTYQWDSPAQSDGCVRYVAHAVDAEGFEHSYPTFGSLGMKIEGGAIVSNDDDCPIWVPHVRPAPACLPPASECTEGATRVCYTGRPGTQDKGICGAGTETCVDGRWEGICEDEVRPEAEDSCGDGEDNNCNGFVDEGCPITVTPNNSAGGDDMGSGGEDMGAGAVDMGTGGEDPDPGKDDEEGGCCATANGADRSAAPLMVLTALLGMLFVRRRR